MKGIDHLISYPRALLFMVLALLCSLLATPARANCATFSADSSLGTISSLALVGNSQRGAAAGGFVCTGSLQLLSTAFIRVSLVNSDFKLVGSQGGTVPFNVFVDPGYTRALQPGQSAEFGATNLLNLGGTGAGVPLYLTTTPGANVPAGTYTGTVTLRWHWAVCDLGLVGICSWYRSPGVVQPCPLGLVCGTPSNWGEGVLTTVRVTLIVTKACQIVSLPAVDLGRKALVSQFTEVSQTLSVRCTNTEGFTLSFGNGQNYQAPWRQMAFGNNRLRYNIYGTDKSMLTPSRTLDAIGTGLNQGFQVQIQVDPNQKDVPPGTYVDNVVLTLSY
ncbi:spore coat U domain-containing protein [Stutzerimonas stutzeri]|uniref:Spore coat U domain-containing protein n=1 Tax=Stutzerimonas stutzeri TaxID=316 RepID=W8RTH9_STUST|nr:spore coat protein U domain-containing protein [Stutzerimonas stutzeri]AHL75371.1 spore coat U domain-containing protein [Stutzerimonas stutzeri]MCQ4328074.1 spore coat protein U domain-containing protein [Stutzerimonas stutzeri]